MSKLFSNEPAGLDLSEGQSHRAVANRIVAQIARPDKLCTIRGVESFKEVTVIGLDGAWGSGKSNVVRMVRNDLEKGDNSGKYAFFEYNVWGHQQDPIRKTILRSLVEFLIEQEGFDREVWEERAQQILSRKTTHFHIDVGCVSTWILLSGLSLLLYPVFRALAGLCSDWCKVFYLAIPLILVFIGYIHAFVRRCGRSCEGTNLKSVLRSSLFDLFGFLKDANFISKRTTIVDEREAGSDELMLFVRNVVDSLNGKRLVMVFDDLDRLPQEKLREFWATLHVLFVDKVLKMRIGKLSVLVPFDRARVLRALAELDDNVRGADILGKTFDAIHRISPLIAEDWRKLYLVILNTAFPSMSKEERSQIWQLFDEVVPECERTPRKLLVSMNATRQAYDDRLSAVPCYYCHLFVLLRDAIFENGTPASNIMTFGFVPKLAGLLLRHLQTHEDDAKRYLSALTFQVDIDHSESILHTEATVEAFESGDSAKVSTLATESDWIPVCKKAILSASRLTQTVAALCGMDDAPLSDEDRASCWKFLYENRGKELVALTKSGEKMANHEKFLVAHLPDCCQEYAKAVLLSARSQMGLSPMQFCERLREFEDELARRGLSIANDLGEWRLSAERYFELARAREVDPSFCHATADRDDVEATLLQRVVDGKDFWTDLGFLLDCWSAESFRKMETLKRILLNTSGLRDNARGIPVVLRFLDVAMGSGWIKTDFTAEALKAALCDSQLEGESRYIVMAALCQSNLQDLATGNAVIDSIWQGDDLASADLLARWIRRFADVCSVTINARICGGRPPLVMAALHRIWAEQGLAEKLDAAFSYTDFQVVVPLAKELKVEVAKI